MAARKTTPVSAETRRLRREVLSLKTRVRRLEAALQRARPPAAKAQLKAAAARWTDHTQAAREQAIRAYEEQRNREFLKINPAIVRLLQERRRALNEYLRQKGFEPEPDIEI